MNELSLFSGAGGGLLGTKLLGWSHVGYVENEKYCQQVIAQRIEDGCLDAAPIFGDIDEFVESGAAKKYAGFVDVVTAGFPCQPFSKAGKQKGGKDPRNKWPATIQCIRDVGPRYALLENVPALLSSGYFPEVLGSLAEAGYNARWTVLGAADVGAPHRRNRLWILAESQHTHPNSTGSHREEKHQHRNLEPADQQVSISGPMGQVLADSNRGACSEGQSRRASGKLSQEGPRLRGGPDQRQARKVVGSGSQDVADSDSDDGGPRSSTVAQGRGPRVEHRGSGKGQSIGRSGEDVADPDGDGQLQQAWDNEESGGRSGNSGEELRGWPTEPDVGRVANGVASRVDRLKALGNGQVPAVVAAAWEMLK